jgi:nitrogen fixation-related uncharacterized protein
MKNESIILLIFGFLSIICGIFNFNISFWGGGKYDDLKNKKKFIRLTNIVLGFIILLAGYALRKNKT